MSEWQKTTARALREQLAAMGQRQLPSNRDGFDEEFDELRSLDYKVRCNRDEFYTASLGSNMSKNRYRDILPNEGTRVKLDPVNERGDGDYINANFIDGRRLFGVPFVYIATQAPLRSTCADFWRMVFENNCTFVVMLCTEIEAGKVKSERYWPDVTGEAMIAGPLSVVLVNENHRADNIFRTLVLRTLDGKERTIHHFQYRRWPDQSVPESSSGLMEIIYTLGRTPLTTQTPIVVHCSGGVGRTGVFLTMHVALSLFQLEQPISVPRIVQYLKYCRSGMVQRKDQYLFCYYAVLREMEKMIWAVETSRHVEDKMGDYPLPNARPQRRSNEYVPRHPAQLQPELPRSTLLGVQTSNERPILRTADHGIRVVGDEALGGGFGASLGGTHRMQTNNFDAGAGFGVGSDLATTLAKLRQENERRRQGGSVAPLSAPLQAQVPSPSGLPRRSLALDLVPPPRGVGTATTTSTFSPSKVVRAEGQISSRNGVHSPDEERSPSLPWNAMRPPNGRSLDLAYQPINPVLRTTTTAATEERSPDGVIPLAATTTTTDVASSRFMPSVGTQEPLIRPQRGAPQSEGLNENAASSEPVPPPRRDDNASSVSRRLNEILSSDNGRDSDQPTLRFPVAQQSSQRDSDLAAAASNFNKLLGGNAPSRAGAGAAPSEAAPAAAIKRGDFSLL